MCYVRSLYSYMYDKYAVMYGIMHSVEVCLLKDYRIHSLLLLLCAHCLVDTFKVPNSTQGKYTTKNALTRCYTTSGVNLDDKILTSIGPWAKRTVEDGTFLQLPTIVEMWAVIK